MIIDFSWLWEQLDGPNVSAIRDGVFSYMKEYFDIRLDTLNDLSIASADTDLLTTLGLLAGLPRPVIQDIKAAHFFFADEYYNPTDRGYAESYWTPAMGGNPPAGGQFTELWETGEESGFYAPTAWYRAMLTTYVDSHGRDGSLALLDEIITAMRKQDNSEAHPDHMFIFFDDIDAVHSTGDFQLFLTSPVLWTSIEIASQLLESLIYGAYAPVPRGTVRIDDIAMLGWWAEVIKTEQPQVAFNIPPKNWEALIENGDAVTADVTDIARVTGTLSDGSEQVFTIKANASGTVTDVPYSVNNWAFPLTLGL